MKDTNFLRIAAIAVVATFSVGTAQAALISGVLTFGGEADGIPGPGINDAIGLSFVSGFIVTSVSGDFDGPIVPGNTGSIADFFFNPLMPTPVNPLMTISGFSYSLESVTIVEQLDMFLQLSGTGTLSAPGFDDTPYNWSLSVDGAGSSFAYSGTLAAVPIPGALLLLMSGLGVLGIRRRT